MGPSRYLADCLHLGYRNQASDIERLDASAYHHASLSVSGVVLVRIAACLSERAVPAGQKHCFSNRYRFVQVPSPDDSIR